MHIFTVEDLIVWFEANFACTVGWPMSRTGEGPAPSIEEMNSGVRGPFKYEVFALRGEDTERDRRLLTNAIAIVFDRKLKRLPSIRGTRLYWRFQEKVLLDGNDGQARVYVRIAIPALAERFEGLPLVQEGREIPSIYVES